MIICFINSVITGFSFLSVKRHKIRQVCSLSGTLLCLTDTIGLHLGLHKRWEPRENRLETRHGKTTCIAERVWFQRCNSL